MADAISIAEGGAARQSHAGGSDARAIQTQVGEAVGSFVTFNHGGDGETRGGIFRPGVTARIAENMARNTGNLSADMFIVFAELNANGAVRREICRTRFPDVDRGQDYALRHVPGDEPACMGDESPGSPMPIIVQLSNNPATTQFWGLKTWSEMENEPSFPTPQGAGQGLVSAALTSLPGGAQVQGARGRAQDVATGATGGVLGPIAAGSAVGTSAVVLNELLR